MKRSVQRCLQYHSDQKIHIIGGGPVGSSVALHLCRQGFKKVNVIERDNTYKIASCMLSAGGIRQQFSLQENILITMYGAEFLRSASKEAKLNSDLPDIQFHEHGYLFLATKDDLLRQNHQTQLDAGVDWIKLYNKQQLSTLFPWLNTDGLTLGSYSNEMEGYFDPWAFVAYMKHKAIELGATYTEGEVVDSVFNSDTTVTMSGATTNKSTNAKLKSLITKNSKTGTLTEINGDVFINAAGAWSNNIISQMRVKNPGLVAAEIPVRPRKRCIFNVHCPEDSSSAPVPPYTTPLTIDPTGVYFRPEGKGGKFIAGVSPNDDPDYMGTKEELEKVDDELFMDIVWPALCDRVPAFEKLKVIGSWAGFYDYNTLDQVFRFLWFLTGIYKLILIYIKA